MIRNLQPPSTVWTSQRNVPGGVLGRNYTVAFFFRAEINYGALTKNYFFLRMKIKKNCVPLGSTGAALS